MSENEWQVVTDKVTLKCLAKKRHFTFPARFGGDSHQIDERVKGDDQPMSFRRNSNEFKISIRYEIRYVKGSIYPFLFMRQPTRNFKAGKPFFYSN